MIAEFFSMLHTKIGHCAVFDIKAAQSWGANDPDYMQSTSTCEVNKEFIVKTSVRTKIDTLIVASIMEYPYVGMAPKKKMASPLVVY